MIIFFQSINFSLCEVTKVNELKAIPPILTNLAKAAKKQQNTDESQVFLTLADLFSKTAKRDTNLETIEGSLQEKLKTGYPVLQEQAAAIGDRGVLRTLTWGKKVTTIQKSLIHRYRKTGEALLSGQDIYICEACGFIFLGEKSPDICPICKAPSKRFSKVN